MPNYPYSVLHDYLPVVRAFRVSVEMSSTISFIDRSRKKWSALFRLKLEMRALIAT